MRLEDVTAEIRPRMGWEAIDLGIALVRRDFKIILAVWVLVVFPILAVILVLCRDTPLLGLAIGIWLKPLFDRLPLHVISRSLFGARPRVREVLRAAPRLLTTWILPALFWRRFSIVRSYVMPVVMLEGLRGKDYVKRAQLLTRESDAQSTWLTMVCAVAELSLCFSLFGLVLLMIPEMNQPDWERMADNWTASREFQIPAIVQWGVTLFYVLAITFVEPFYVGGGFGLYVNSRSRAEGWDLQLGFQRLAGRLRRAMAGANKVALWLVPAMLWLLFSPPAGAQSTEVERQIEEVLAQPEFEVATRTIVEYVRENRGRSMNFTVMEGLLEFLFWTAVAVLIGFLVYWLYRYRHLLKNATVSRKRAGVDVPPVKTVMGLDVQRASLPDDIASAAWQAWTRGEAREALSLLYRGAISWLVERERLPILESDTENDCVVRTRGLPNRHQAGYFAELTDQWVRMAYGQLPPDESVMRSLCEAWPFDGVTRA